MATMLLGLLALALVAQSGAAFCGAVPRSASHRSTTMPRMSVDLEGEAAVPPPALDMSLLQQRIEIARDAPERVRLFVLETALLPRQRATLPVPDSVVREIQEEIAAGGTVAVIGTTDDCVGEVPRLHSHGVAVDLVNSLTYGDGDCVIDLVGARKFEFDELLTDEPGYTEASVRWIDNGDAEEEDGWDRAVAQEKCGDLERLLLRWISLVRSLRLEGEPGELSAVLNEVGELPETTQPAELAEYAAAVIGDRRLRHAVAGPVPGLATLVMSEKDTVGAVKKALVDSIDFLEAYSLSPQGLAEVDL